MKYLDLYKEEIASGRAVIGKWMELNLAFIENGLKNGDFFYDDKKGEAAIAFIERFCHHVEGSTSLIKLEPWQKYFLACVFGIVDEKGYRQFREVVLVMGRKQGKSLIAGGIEVKMAYTEHEPGAQIYNLAPKLKQANIIYNVVYKMIQRVPALNKRAKKRRTDIYLPKENVTLEPIAFASKKSDGFNPQMTTFDEFAAWEGEAGLKMYNVMLSAGGARKQPLYFAISTANYIDDGLYDELMARGTAVLQGTSKERRLLPFIFMIDDPKKWNDITELKKAMPNLGVSVSEEFMQEEINKALGNQTYRLEFLTKYCNLKQNSVVAWLNRQQINSMICDELSLEDFRDHYAVGGIDLSQTTDLTAASVIIQKNGIDYVFSQFFLPKNKIQELSERDHIRYENFVRLGYLTPSGENFVDYHDVSNWFEMLRHKYGIACCVIGYDRYSSQYLVDEMKKKGYKMDDVIQGVNLTPVVYEVEGLITDGVVKTGTNGLLQSHFASAALVKVAEDNRVRVVKVDKRKHIDGLVSVLDAYTVRQKWSKDYMYLLDNSLRG